MRKGEKQGLVIGRTQDEKRYRPAGQHSMFLPYEISDIFLLEIQLGRYISFQDQIDFHKSKTRQYVNKEPDINVLIYNPFVFSPEAEQLPKFDMLIANYAARIKM